jgi:hypothetical protein
MKPTRSILASATVATALIAALSMSQAAVDATQDVLLSNAEQKADRALPASAKGDLLPIAGSFAPVTHVMTYQVGPTESVVLPLPATVLSRS